MSSTDENTSLIFEQAKQVLLQYDSVIKSIDNFDKEKEQNPVVPSYYDWAYSMVTFTPEVEAAMIDLYTKKDE